MINHSCLTAFWKRHPGIELKDAPPFTSGRGAGRSSTTSEADAGIYLDNEPLGRISEVPSQRERATIW